MEGAKVKQDFGMSPASSGQLIRYSYPRNKMNERRKVSIYKKKSFSLSFNPAVFRLKSLAKGPSNSLTVGTSSIENGGLYS